MSDDSLARSTTTKAGSQSLISMQSPTAQSQNTIDLDGYENALGEQRPSKRGQRSESIRSDLNRKEKPSGSCKECAIF